MAFIKPKRQAETRFVVLLRDKTQAIKKATKTSRHSYYIRNLESNNYLIFASLKSTCLRTTGSYLRITIFSVMLRGFFLVT